MTDAMPDGAMLTVVARMQSLAEELELTQQVLEQLKQRFWAHEHYPRGWQKRKVRVEVQEWSK